MDEIIDLTNENPIQLMDLTVVEVVDLTHLFSFEDLPLNLIIQIFTEFLNLGDIKAIFRLFQCSKYFKMQMECDCQRLFRNIYEEFADNLEFHLYRSYVYVDLSLDFKLQHYQRLEKSMSLFRRHYDVDYLRTLDMPKGNQKFVVENDVVGNMILESGFLTMKDLARLHFSCSFQTPWFSSKHRFLLFEQVSAFQKTLNCAKNASVFWKEPKMIFQHDLKICRKCGYDSKQEKERQKLELKKDEVRRKNSLRITLCYVLNDLLTSNFGIYTLKHKYSG